MDKAVITLSESAVARVKKLMLEKPEMVGIRVGLATKGCSGFVHTLDYALAAEEGDERIEQDGAVVLVSAKAVPIVFGTTLEWVEEDLEARFVFHNPNAKSSCGCGESFSVD